MQLTSISSRCANWLSLNLFLFCTLIIVNAETKAQMLGGGRGNYETNLTEVKPSSISRGGVKNDVNLFTGALQTNYDLGTVKTPCGLSFNLQLNYSSEYTFGDMPPVLSGVPYGENWNLNIPTVTVFNESYAKYDNQRRNALLHSASPLAPTSLDMNLGDLIKEAELISFSPIINIPGEVSERFVFKYLSKGEAVFIPHKFDKYVEARYAANKWTVYLSDGRIYIFGKCVYNVRNASNTNFYKVDGVDLQGTSALSNSILPKKEVTSWFCSEIFQPNCGSAQRISFGYKEFGNKNYYKEFEQSGFNHAFMAEAANGAGFYGGGDSYEISRDIILVNLVASDKYSNLDEIELNYATYTNDLASGDMPIYYWQNQNHIRTDSMYTAFNIYTYGAETSEEKILKFENQILPIPSVANNDFDQWKRYLHVKQFENGHTQQEFYNFNNDFNSNITNPYLHSQGNGEYFRKKIIGAEMDIQFDHSFIESPVIKNPIAGSGLFVPGEIYELRTILKEGGNCNFDINIVGFGPGFGLLNSETTSDGYLPNSIYDQNRCKTILSTFNQAVKWNPATCGEYDCYPFLTSNIFAFPNVQKSLNGFVVQIGPGNSDNDFGMGTHSMSLNYPLNVYPPAIIYPNTSELIFNSYFTYFNYKYYPSIGSYVAPAGFKCDVPIRNNFGIGMPWHMMRNFNTSGYFDGSGYSNSYGSPNISQPPTGIYKNNWWVDMNLPQGATWSNRPTLTNQINSAAQTRNAKLGAVAIIRHSKNPYMLSSVKHYVVNGVLNDNQKGNLVDQTIFDYSVARIATYDNINFNLPNNHKTHEEKIRGFRHVYFLKSIKQIPISLVFGPKYLGDIHDIEMYPTTQFKYQNVSFNEEFSVQSNIGQTDQFTSYAFPNVNIEFYRLIKIIDQMGMETKFEYYNPINSAPLNSNSQRFFISGSSSNNPLNGVSLPIPNEGMSTALSLIFCVKNKTIINGDDTLINKKEWKYIYYDKFNTNNTSYLSSFSHLGSFYTRMDQGWGKTVVIEPEIKSGVQRCYSNYYHYGVNSTPLTSDYNSDANILMGKLYKLEKFDEFGNLQKQKITEYFNFEAYKTGIARLDNLHNNGYILEDPSDNYIREEYPDYNDDFQFTSMNDILSFQIRRGACKDAVSQNFANNIVRYGDLDLFDIYANGNTVNVVDKVYLNARFTGIKKETETDYECQLKNLVEVNLDLESSMLSSISYPSKVDLTDEKTLIIIDELIKSGLSVYNDEIAKWFRIFNDCKVAFDQEELKSYITKVTDETYTITKEDLNEIISKIVVQNNTLITKEEIELYREKIKNKQINILELRALLSKYVQIPEYNKEYEEYLSSLENTYDYNAPLLDIVFSSIIANDEGSLSQNTFDIISEKISKNNLTVVDLNNLFYVASISRKIEVNELEWWANRISNPSEYPLKQEEVEKLLSKIKKKDNLSISEFDYLLFSKTIESELDLKNNRILLSSLLERLNRIIVEGTNHIPEDFVCSGISNTTEYDYWRATSTGHEVNDCFVKLLSNNYTDGLNTQGNLLYAEPSWELYTKKTYSNELADAYKLEEYFYYYDLRQLIKNELSGENYRDEQEVLSYNQEYGYTFRNLPYEIKTINKMPGKHPIATSKYFTFSRSWNENPTAIPEFLPPIINTTTVGDCGVNPDPVPNPLVGQGCVPCENCYHVLIYMDQDPPPGYVFVEYQGIPFFCPAGENYSQFASNPQRDLFGMSNKKKLHLKSEVIQVDTILKPDYLCKSLEMLNMSGYSNLSAVKKYPIMRFERKEIPNPGLLSTYIYAPYYPFDTLKTYEIILRTDLSLPCLVEDEKGLKTKFYYDQSVKYQQYNFNNAHCNYSTIERNNIGMPNCITQGFGLPDSLRSCFDFTSLNQLSKITDPNNVIIDYTYDDFGRLKNHSKNNNLVNSYEYHNFENDYSLLFSARTDQNYTQVKLFNKQFNQSTIGVLSRTYLDPLGRTISNFSCSFDENANVVVSNTANYTGSLTFDGWDRQITQHQSFNVDISGGAIPINTSNYLTDFTSTSIESNFKGRTLETAEYGMILGGSNTSKFLYAIRSQNTVASELGMTQVLKNKIFPVQNLTDKVYVNTSFDQDNKISKVYLNAIGMKFAEMKKNGSEKIITFFIKDSQGRDSIVINPEGQELKYYYNLLGWLYKTSSVDAGDTRMMYNRSGKVVIKQDQNGYDGIHENSPWALLYDYDAFGNLIAQKRVFHNPLSIGVSEELMEYPPLYYQNGLLHTINGFDNTVRSIYHFSSGMTCNWTYGLYNLHPLPPGSPSQAYCTAFARIWSKTINDPVSALNSTSIKEKEFKYTVYNAIDFPGNITSNFTTGNYDLTNYSSNNFSKGKLCFEVSYKRGSNTIATEVNLYSYDTYGNLKHRLQQFNENGIAASSPVPDILTKVSYDNYTLTGKPGKETCEFIDANGVGAGKTYSYAHNEKDQLTQIDIDDFPSTGNGFKIAELVYNDTTGTLDQVKYFSNVTCGGNSNPLVDQIIYKHELRGKLKEISGNYYQENLYYYNIHPQITPILPALSVDTSFKVNSTYNYNGNINSVAHRYKINGFANPTTGFGNNYINNEIVTYTGYAYDGLNRLTSADYSLMDKLDLGLASSNQYLPRRMGDESFTYDKVGNFESITSNKYLNGPITALADIEDVQNYEYYASSNKLWRFNSNKVYLYDHVGNFMQKSLSVQGAIYGEGFRAELYNSANLPTMMVFDPGNMNNPPNYTFEKYVYNNSDKRIFKAVTDEFGVANANARGEFYLVSPSGNIMAIKKFENDCYTNDWFVYGNNRIASIKEEFCPDQANPSNINATKHEPVFYNYDHLGNMRVSYTNTCKPISGGDDIFETTITSLIEYYPFGGILRSYENTSGNHKFKFGSKERDNSTGLDYFEARFFDSEARRFVSVDPMSSNAPDWTPYRYGFCNPIMFTDPSGMWESTHTDEYGNVVAVYDDGDNSVYKHNGNSEAAKSEIDKIYSPLVTSANGTKMGETLTPLGFADFELFENTGEVKPAPGAFINFNSNWASAQVNTILSANPNPLTYASLARGGNDWDIKANSPNGNPYFGSKLFGKYASARDAGNFAAGAVAQNSILPNFMFDYGYGTYNLSNNNVDRTIFSIGTDILTLPVVPGFSMGSAYYKAKYGESPLTKMGIEAGKKYIKNK